MKKLVAVLALLVPTLAFGQYSVQLSWKPSPSPDVAGYNVYYGPQGSGTFAKSDAGNNLTLILTGLTYDVNYELYVTAYRANEESGPSPKITFVRSAVNTSPTLDPVEDIVVPANSGPYELELTGITSGSIFENQFLMISASSDNPGLIPNPSIEYVSPDTTAILSFAVQNGPAGGVNIAVCVNDGQSVNSLFCQGFLITVEGAANQPPGISTIPDVFMAKNASFIVQFMVNDDQTPLPNLVVSASSSNNTLISSSQMTLSGNGEPRTLKLVPKRNKTGTATIKVMVSDGSLESSASFQLTVAR